MSSRRRTLVVAVLLVAVVVATLTLYAARARGADLSRCDRFAAASVARAAQVSGSGERVVVIGDSYSAGLGLTSPSASWPSRLPGRVHVAGFSGSGFSEGASDCGRVSFADRARAAVRGGASLVVVEGGLNDYDQSETAIRAGFARLVRELRGLPVVVVGPVTAPSRAGAVPRVDALLSELCEARGIPYVATSDLRLAYLDDRLHLTPAAHRVFGDAVAARIAALS
nr:SGNH/GDSL hydrolase family protein [Nocardioides luti]